MCHVHFCSFSFFKIPCFTLINIEAVDYFDMALRSPFLLLFDE